MMKCREILVAFYDQGIGYESMVKLIGRMSGLFLWQRGERCSTN
jgi:hypothetical protein